MLHRFSTFWKSMISDTYWTYKGTSSYRILFNHHKYLWSSRKIYVRHDDIQLKSSWYYTWKQQFLYKSTVDSSVSHGNSSFSECCNKLKNQYTHALVHVKVYINFLLNSDFWSPKENPTSILLPWQNTLAIQASLRDTDQEREMEKTYWINQIDHAKGHDVITNYALADNIYSLTNGYLPCYDLHSWLD